MAAQPVSISPFPQPPEYARQYTDTNVAKKNVLPPPIVPTEFTVFGEEYNFEEVFNDLSNKIPSGTHRIMKWKRPSSTELF